MTSDDVSFRLYLFAPFGFSFGLTLSPFIPYLTEWRRRRKERSEWRRKAPGVRWERADDRRDERRLPRSFVSRHPFSYLGLTALSSASHHDRRSSVPLSLTPSVRAAKRALRAIRYGGECKVNGQRQEPHEPTEVATEGAGWQEHRESIPPIDLTSLVLHHMLFTVVGPCRKK